MKTSNHYQQGWINGTLIPTIAIILLSFVTLTSYADKLYLKPNYHLRSYSTASKLGDGESSVAQSASQSLSHSSTQSLAQSRAQSRSGKLPTPSLAHKGDSGVHNFVGGSKPSENTHALRKRYRMSSHWHQTVSFMMYPGSLESNVKRIAAHYGWRHVEWNLSEDYRWVGHTRITAHNLTFAFTRILQDYPLQAVFYSGNHVIAIEPRTV